MKRYDQGSIGMRKDKDGAWCDYEEANAEIERLRADYALLSDDYKQLLGDVERLRGDLEDQRKDTVCDEQRIADLMADVQRQGQEIERLRGLLRDGLNMTDEIWEISDPIKLGEWEKRVREVLGDG